MIDFFPLPVSASLSPVTESEHNYRRDSIQRKGPSIFVKYFFKDTYLEARLL